MDISHGSKIYLAAIVGYKESFNNIPKHLISKLTQMKGN